MRNILTKEQVVSQRFGALNESVFKQGDIYKVKSTVEIPKSLINAFVSKAKKENDIDPRESWSDMDLAEMFVQYIAQNYITIESLPVGEILGTEAKSPSEIQTDVQPAEMSQSQEPIQIQEPVQEVPAGDNEPTAEIQTEGILSKIGNAIKGILEYDAKNAYEGSKESQNFLATDKRAKIQINNLISKGLTEDEAKSAVKYVFDKNNKNPLGFLNKTIEFDAENKILKVKASTSASGSNI